MNLPHLFRLSIYSPQFYRELLRKSRGFSFRYFFGLVSVLALAVTLILTVIWGPSAARFAHSLGPRLAELYPAELAVTFKDGVVTSNVSEPYFLAMPPELRDADLSGDHLLVIDTQTPFSVEKFREYRTIGWLRQKELVWEDSGQIRIRTLEQMPDAVVDRAAVEGLAERIRRAAGWAAPLLVLGLAFAVFLGVFAVYLFDLAYLLLAAFLVWGIARIYEWRIPYGKAYQIGLHAMGLGMILQALRWLGLPVFPYAFTLLLIFVTWINLSQGESQPQPETAAPAVLEPEG